MKDSLTKFNFTNKLENLIRFLTKRLFYINICRRYSTPRYKEDRIILI